MCKSGVRTGRMLIQPQTSLYSAVKTLKNKLHTNAFWSSSENNNNNNNAWKQRFSDGNQNNNNKNNTNSVRAVRDFAQRQAQADVKICLCHFGIYFMDNLNCLKNEQNDFPVTIEDVFEAYYECRKHKRNKSGALKFEVNLEENLIQLWNDLCSGNYKPKPSVVFIVEEPVKREIFAANFRDRIVHHLVLKYLNPIFEQYFIYDSYSCREGKGTHFGIKRISDFMKCCSLNNTRKCWILKTDIRGYFMSINKSILFAKLESFIKSNYFNPNRDFIINLCRIIIFNNPTKNCIFHSSKNKWNDLPKDKSLFFAAENCGLPIGNFTSQVFANFYLTEFDKFIKNICGIKFYGRYVDDCVIVHKSKSFLLKLVLVLRYYLKSQLGLKLHPKKISLQPVFNGVRFLGCFVKHSHIVVNKRIIRNFKRSVALHNYLAMLHKPDVFEIQHFISSVNSYLGIMRHYKTYRIRSHILNQDISSDWKKHICFSSDFNKIQLKRGAQ